MRKLTTSIDSVIIEEHIERLIAEGSIGMAEAARMMGTFRDGKRCHTSTISRWCSPGIKLPDGRVIRLEHYRSAGRMMTSRAALIRFIAKQQQDVDLPNNVLM